MPLLFAIALVLLALFVYVVRYSGRISARYQRRINVGASLVRATVTNYSTWPSWFPWLEHDPEVELELGEARSSAAGRCAWRTARAGEYEIIPRGTRSGQAVEFRVVAREPFRYVARMRWDFAAMPEGGTQVTMTIRGRVAFALRAFAPTVRGALTLDCRYGLDKLARYLEGETRADGPDNYRIEYLGVRDISSANLLTRNWQGKIADLRGGIKQNIALIKQELNARGLLQAGYPSAAFLSTHIKNGTTRCRIGVPVGQDRAAPANLELHKQEAFRAYVLRLHGDRSALDVAWYEGMQRLRVENLMADQRLPPIECYLEETESPGPVLTELLLPIRGG